MKTRPLALMALLMVSVALPAAASADAIDEFVAGYMQRHQVPGIALAVTRDGQVVRAAGYGLANVELDVPVTPATVFQSGSVGKQFTAMAVMMLVDEGKLGLDDRIAKYFPGAPATWQDITVRHLLTHTSGIKDWEGKTDIDYRRDYTEDELVQVAMKLAPDFAPGTQWSYSNTGYVLLGILVHKASGKFYGDFLAERVFKPLGMSATRVISESDIVKNRAAGYTRESGKLQNQEWVSPSLNTTADGSIYTTALDMAKWDAALGARRFLQPSSYEAMWSPVRLRDGTTYPYGFAWSLDEQRGEPVIQHGGSWQGFRAAIVRYPARKLSVIVLANLAEAEPERLATALAGLVEPALAWPDVRAAVADPDPARTARMRDVLQSWAKGEPTAAMATGLRNASAGKTARAVAGREELQQQLAQSRGFTFLAEDDERERGLELRGEKISRVVFYFMPGERDHRFRFFLNDAGEVAEFSSEPVD
jgi:CubicO group peptidase (beta-lactamase class C family)